MFEKLIETNGMESCDSNGLTIKCFDIIPYAEKEIFKVCSSKSTYPPNQKAIIQIYEKAAGKKSKEEEAEISYEEEMEERRNSFKILAPRTKHQKRVDLREKKMKGKKMKH